MRNNNAKTTRPAASEAQIREMHDRAAGHGKRAEEHETQAAWVIGEAEQSAQAYVAKAQETAAEMVRQAQAQADADVMEAHKAAQSLRDVRDEEARGQAYWSSLAAEEAVAAGLPQVTSTLTDGLDASGATQ